VTSADTVYILMTGDPHSPDFGPIAAFTDEGDAGIYQLWCEYRWLDPEAGEMRPEAPEYWLERVPLNPEATTHE
jgi:hypothetical protein